MSPDPQSRCGGVPELRSRRRRPRGARACCSTGSPSSRSSWSSTPWSAKRACSTRCGRAGSTGEVAAALAQKRAGEHPAARGNPAAARRPGAHRGGRARRSRPDARGRGALHRARREAAGEIAREPYPTSPASPGPTTPTTRPVPSAISCALRSSSEARGSSQVWYFTVMSFFPCEISRGSKTTPLRTKHAFDVRVREDAAGRRDLHRAGCASSGWRRDRGSAASGRETPCRVRPPRMRPARSPCRAPSAGTGSSRPWDRRPAYGSGRCRRRRRCRTRAPASCR